MNKKRVLLFLVFGMLFANIALVGAQETTRATTKTLCETSFSGRWPEKTRETIDPTELDRWLENNPLCKCIFKPELPECKAPPVTAEKLLDPYKTYCWKCYEEIKEGKETIKPVILARGRYEDCLSGENRIDLYDEQTEKMISSSTNSDLERGLVTEKLVSAEKIDCKLFVLKRGITKESEKNIIDKNNNGLLDDEDSCDVILNKDLSLKPLFGKELIIYEGTRIKYRDGKFSIYATRAKEEVALKYGEELREIKWGDSVTISKEGLSAKTVSLVNRISLWKQFGFWDGIWNVDKVKKIVEYELLEEEAPEVITTYKIIPGLKLEEILKSSMISGATEQGINIDELFDKLKRGEPLTQEERELYEVALEHYSSEWGPIRRFFFRPEKYFETEPIE